MAALDFPSSPTNGQTYTANGKTWTYDSTTTSWLYTPSTLGVSGGGTGLTSLTANYIPFGNGTSAFGSSSDFTWDNTAKDLRINGQIGVGSAPQASVQFDLGGTMPSSANTSYSVNSAQTIPATSTTLGSGFSTGISTAAAAFTCTTITHFAANQGTFGAGSTVTNQYGFYASANLIGAASNNFGYWSGIPSGTGRWNFYAAGTADNYFAGSVGLGIATPAANIKLQISGTAPSSSATSYSVYNNTVVPATSTAGASYFTSSASTAAAAFTLANLQHFYASQGTIGAGSTVTNQFGFFVDAGLTGATNNYGFYSNIPAGTGEWNFYANGTAPNYFAGKMHLGATTASAIQFYLGGTAQSGTDVYSVYTDQVIPATATSSASAITSNLSTAASAFTLSALNHFLSTQGTIGAGSTVTNQRGFYAHNSLTGATNNYGFYSDIAAGTGRWNFYANNTAANFFAGALGIGAGAGDNMMFRVGGAARASGGLAYSVYADQAAFPTATSEFASFYSIPSVVASAFTVASLFHYIAVQGGIGAGAAITDQFGFYVASSLTGATNNFGFYSNIAAATNRWNFYANGTAQNFFRGDTGVGIAPDGTQVLHVAAGTTAKAAIELNAGTNMTTVDAGSVEYDGTCLYFTPFGSSRSALVEEQLVVLGATNTLTSQTGAQPLFDNATAAGAVTLAVGTYQFECFFSLSAMSATSGSFGFALVAGTAVIGSQGWQSFAQKGTATLTTATAGQATYSTAANTAIATASVNTVGYAFIKGFFRVTTAGTIVPSVSLGQAAAAVVGVQSYFKCSPVNPTATAATNLTVGNWS